MSDQKAYQIALGNVDINNGNVLADFDPDTFVVGLRPFILITIIKIRNITLI